MMIEKKYALLLCSFIIMLLVLTGCLKPPAESAVIDLITRYFESRGFHVTEIRIGEIRPIPLGKREYMTTRGHLVHISSIMLTNSRDDERSSTFTDAVIEIHRSRGYDSGWVITGIQGIPLQ